MGPNNYGDTATGTHRNSNRDHGPRASTTLTIKAEIRRRVFLTITTRSRRGGGAPSPHVIIQLTQNEQRRRKQETIVERKG